MGRECSIIYQPKDPTIFWKEKKFREIKKNYYCTHFLLLWAACWQLYKKTNIFLQLQLKIECVIVWIAFVSQSLMREKLSSIYANIYTLNVYHLAPLAFPSLALGSEVNCFCNISDNWIRNLYTHKNCIIFSHQTISRAASRFARMIYFRVYDPL